jgi:hypothetical protein
MRELFRGNITVFAWTGYRKPRKNFSRKSAKIRTEHLHSRSLNVSCNNRVAGKSTNKPQLNHYETSLHGKAETRNHWTRKIIFHCAFYIHYWITSHHLEDPPSPPPLVLWTHVYTDIHIESPYTELTQTQKVSLSAHFAITNIDCLMLFNRLKPKLV